MRVRGVRFTCLFGLVVASVIPFAAAQQPVRLSDPGANGSELFASSVSIWGDYAVVGVPDDDDMGSLSGSAFIYRREGTNWVAEAHLFASDANSGDYFGTSVAIWSNRVVVGAVSKEFVPTGIVVHCGAAYVFERTATNWTQRARLLADTTAHHQYFGRSVDIHGDVLIVGAPGESNVTAEAGAAYLFEREDGNWVSKARLTSDDPGASERLGSSVSVDDTIAVASAPFYGLSNAVSCGAVYVFDRPPGGWVDMAQNARLTAMLPHSGARLGSAVSLDETSVVAGAPDESSLRGAAYVFARPSGGSTNATERQKLYGSTTIANNKFGDSVAMDGEWMSVGAPWAGGSAAGAAFVFRRGPGEVWEETTVLVSPDSDSAAAYGKSMGLSGENILVGDPWDNHPFNRAGAAYVHTIVAPDYASSPSPGHGATGLSGWTTQLSWSNGTGTATIDLYVDTVDPPQAMVLTNAPAVEVYDPPDPLLNDTQYFWRVVCRAAGGHAVGDVWSFSTRAPPVLGTSPAVVSFGWVQIGTTSTVQHITVTNSGPDILGGEAWFDAADPMYVNGTHGPVPYNVPPHGSLQFDVTFRPPYVADFDKRFRMTSNDPLRPTHFVRVVGTGLPGQAHSPSPAHGASMVPIDALLTWSNGMGTVSIDLLLDLVNPPVQKVLDDVAAVERHDPGLELGRTYFWRVVCRNGELYTEGPVWRFATVPEPSISLREPNGGEEWPMNSRQTILWTSVNAGPAVKIELWSETLGNPQYVEDIVASTSNDGSYAWTLPTGHEPGEIYYVKVIDLSDESVTDMSDRPFDFLPPVPGVAGSPLPKDGGENVSRSADLAWSNGSLTERIDLYFGPAEGAVAKVLDGVAAMEAHTLPMLDALTRYCWWVVCRNGNGETTGPEWSFITGTEATLAVTVPNGGEVWHFDSRQEIRWDYPDGENVKLELWTTLEGAPAYLETLAERTRNDGAYPWDIGDRYREGPIYLIKVMDSSDTNTADFSDSEFTLREAPQQPVLVITRIAKRGSDIVLSWEDGGGAGPYHVLTTTDLLAPFTTNAGCPTNGYVHTNALDAPVRFYSIGR